MSGANKTWDAVDHYYSGQGVVLLAKRGADGLPEAFIPVGNVPDLRITVQTNALEHKESHTGQRGTDKRITTETIVGLSMTLENFSGDNLARVSRGIVTNIAAGTHSITRKAYLGGIVALEHVKVSAVVVKKDATTIDAVNYEVNSEAGSIRFKDVITGGTLAEGDTITIEYSYEKQVRVDGLAGGQEELFMRFEGLNTAEGNVPVVINVFKFATDPFQELALISDEIQSSVLEGSVLADTTRNSGSRYFEVLQTK